MLLEGEWCDRDDGGVQELICVYGERDDEGDEGNRTAEAS